MDPLQNQMKTTEIYIQLKSSWKYGTFKSNPDRSTYFQLQAS